MTSLLEIIVARKQSFGGITLSAAEVEHLVLATVAAALDMACNAVSNEMDASDANDARGVIDPERILAELKEDFTANVQQYWPAPMTVKEFTASLESEWPAITRADVAKAHEFGKGPVSELGLTARDTEKQRIIGYAKTAPITEADAPLYGHDKDKE